jgi:hypothetical protein
MISGLCPLVVAQEGRAPRIAFSLIAMKKKANRRNSPIVVCGGLEFLTCIKF